MTVTRPTNLQIPFADIGIKNDIPITSPPRAKANAASFTLGFPHITRLGVTAGGIQPEGPDWNGILNYITQHILFRNIGGRYKFEQSLADAVGGYSAGMVLQSDNRLNEYVSLVNNNTTNFNTHPESIGFSWQLFSGVSSLGTPGTISLCATSAVPSGFLECNGAALLRASYPSLFGVIGTTYGPGNGSTTFNIPDLRGYFPRGWAHGSTVDPGKATRTNRGDGVTGDAVGTKQTCSVKSHTHACTFLQPYPATLSTVRPQYDPGLTPPYYLSSYYGVGDTRPININVMPVIKY